MTRKYCPFCNSNKVKTLTEEDDGQLKTILCFCKDCDEAFTIQTGSQVEEWYNEAKEQL